MTTGIMGKKAARYTNWIAVLLGLTAFLGALSGVHQMQMAEGIGLYWALKAGVKQQVFDILTDLSAAFAMILLVILPCVILRHRSIRSAFRFLTGFLAFMPSLSMSYLIHLFDEGGRSIDPEFLLSVYSLLLPFACLLLLGVGCFEKPWKKWYGVLGLTALALGIGTFWEAGILGFLLAYVLLVVCFDAWERLLALCSRLEIFGWILFGGLWLRAVYCIILLRSLY